MGGVSSSKMPNNPIDERIDKKKKNEKRIKQIEKKRLKALEKEKKKLKKEAKTKIKMKGVKPPIQPVLTVRPDRSNEINRDSADKSKLKEQLSRDSEAFILNQILLCVEFFRNYRWDIEAAAKLNKKQQLIETNKISQYNKRVLILDRIIETMEKTITYIYRHGPKKGTPQTLQRFTKYIIFDNIEIVKQSEVEDEIYSKIGETSDRPPLKIVIDNDEKFNKVDNEEHVGFYRLRNSELFISSKYGQRSTFDNYDEDEDDDVDNDEEISRETKLKPNPKIRDSIAVPKLQAKRIQHQMLKNSHQSVVRPSSSTPSPSSSEYDYTYINKINSHRPINEMRTTFATDERLSAQTIPQSCFINVIMKQEEDDEDEDDENYNKKPVQIKQSFHSKTFFYYFTNAFRYILAKELGFEQAEIDNTTWKGASLFIEPFEIIPAIECKWPDQIAYNFNKRQRKPILNQATGLPCQWPSQEVIKHIINITPCHIIPNGYVSKGGNPERDFEWQIVFPAAEQLLESNLSNAQLKLYVLFKVLIKTFIEPLIEDKYNLTDHIRHHLFWQFERVYPVMTDEYLGERLIHLLKTLLVQLGKTSLPDYFLPKRNLFHNIPSEVLITVHEGLYRITEFPTRHIIIALRNLHVIDNPFYPKFDFKRLYEKLTENAISLINPQLSTQKKNPYRESPPDDDFNGIIAVGAIGLLEQQANKEKKVKRTVRFNDNKLKKRKDSGESIHEFIVDKRMDEQRREVIFKLLIPHYLKMAKAASNFQSFDLSLLYLNQSEILCSILAESNDNTQTYTSQIQEIREKVLELKLTNSRLIPTKSSSTPPPLPRRESILDPKQQRRITLARKSVTIQETEDDPYTNIELIRNSIAIQPAEFNDSSDDEQPNGIVQNGPRKSILSKNNHLPNVIRIENVQVHTPREPTIENENENITHINKVKFNTNNNTTAKKSANIANRRKSSTKFSQITNGYDNSDDSDETNVNDNKKSTRFDKIEEITKKTTTSNIGNRRKSSTKFIPILNGHGEDDSDKSDEIQVDEKRNNLTHNNKEQETNNSNTTTKTVAKKEPRRKSSTKFMPSVNGYGEDSDESDEPYIEEKKDISSRSNKAQEIKNSSTTTKSSANIAARRKSSTKFIQPNGYNDSDEDEAEDTLL